RQRAWITQESRRRSTITPAKAIKKARFACRSRNIPASRSIGSALKKSWSWGVKPGAGFQEQTTATTWLTTSWKGAGYQAAKTVVTRTKRAQRARATATRRVARTKVALRGGRLRGVSFHGWLSE